MNNFIQNINIVPWLGGCDDGLSVDAGRQHSTRRGGGGVCKRATGAEQLQRVVLHLLYIVCIYIYLRLCIYIYVLCICHIILN